MKLLSWNIQWGRGIDGKVDLARILTTIQQLGDFDIICLQEVAINFPGLPGSEGEDQFKILSAGLPDYTAIYSPATDVPNRHDNHTRSHFGNAVFSRLPVGQIWRHLLPWAAEPATPSMQRSLVEAAIISDDLVPIRIMTTHLEYYSRQQRALQIETIRHLHAEACRMSQHSMQTVKQSGPFETFPRPAEAILCGDLNFPATACERSQILAPFDSGIPALHDARTLLYPYEPHAPTVGIHPVDFVDQPECFDYIFITDGLKKRLKSYGTDPITQASDHQPVWIELA
ncbi:Metal-dependent hydrolase, endonuclease/exonuclease/phosphatase family [Nitrosomonas aestuarii]|uniref:Metal-dependent hydrolase, endonuclease/exonuclease/phosphatase family n=1 Tax=Nitrosomonas aestuarii TaxID=52441 RepID=A0A1I4AKL1_9PROT|nr:endonuclease/exonuclease/phosphatase family protein [Nitrosomonas aestuarii]SFK56803.1 Metal-dependent hydrolase, endonuclease/exonuclease/phosphatase family [Nitrosomonas aestuarii]